MNHSLSLSIFRSLAASLLALLLAGCSADNNNHNSTATVLPVLVHVVDNTQLDHDIHRTVPGVLVPRYASDMSFQVAGKISQRLVEVGQQVKKGQALLRLDDKDYLLALTAAEADSVQATADEKRFNSLLEKGVISASEHERYSVRAEAARAQFQLAQNRVQYSTLIAPFDGVVTALRAEAGQVIGEGMPVVSLARTDDIEVEVDLAEALAADIERYHAIAQLSGEINAQYPLQLRELSPAASQPLRTYKARFSFRNLNEIQQKDLRLGMTAQVRLSASVNVLEQKEQGVLLPASALITTVAEPSVWVLPQDGEFVTAHKVKVLAFYTDKVLVSGLPQGSRVVIAGVQKLDEKIRVRAVVRTGSGVDNSLGAH